MAVNALQKLSMQAQAKLSQWLNDLCTDSYDAIRYDSHIHRLLAETNVDYQTYATVPWIDYCNPGLKTWTIFVMQQGEWSAVTLPNPFYQLSKPRTSTTLSAEAM